MDRQNRFFSHATFLLIVFTLFVVAVPVMAYAATLYVASDGGDTQPYDTWTKAATSIQTAIDDAGTGDVIIVGSSDGHSTGTYNENLEVNKQVTIQSENGNSTTTVVASSADDHVFEVTEDNVTINGFSIKSATGSEKAGIYLDTVDDCTIENNRCGWDASNKNTRGIYLVTSGSCTISGNTCSYNTGEGIYLKSSSNNNTLSSNIANNNSGDGISFDTCSGNTVTGNTASNNTMDGIRLVPSCSDNTFNNNTASSNGNNGFLIVASSNNNFTGNTANSNTGNHGIYLTSSSDNNTLTSNTADSNAGNGILLEGGSSGNELISNTVTHNDFGIFVTSSSNNTFTSNIMNENNGIYDGDGIMLESSSNCVIENNTANNNPGDGIELYNASNNTIKGNTLDTSSLPDPGASMRINYYSSYNTIVNNTVINGAGGIVLEEESNYNFVSNNTVTGHTGRGFEFYENASYNTLTGNNISNNGTYGVWLPLVDPPEGPAGNYNQIYLNDFINNSTSNIFSEMSTTTWHSPTTIYYNYNSGTYHKGYLGNYYSDGTHTGSYGIGSSSYAIANDNDDDYQLIKTSDYYSLQAWWLHSDNKMYRDEMTKAGESVTISSGSSNIWIADQAALTAINFSGSDTWTGQVIYTSAPTNEHTFAVEIGSSTDGSDFTAGGPDVTITGDGSATVFPFTTDASAFSVSIGNYLALKLTSNHAEYSVRTGGAWSYCSSPDNSTDYSLPVELSTFTAQFIENTPTLYWTTQSETSNAGWNIYRGENDDALSNEETYLLNLSLGLIPGAGTTSEPTDYIFEDVFPIVEGTTYFYWLESVDYSGESEIYGPISLTIPENEWQNPNSPEIPKPYGLHQNYPNPFNPHTEISFMMKESCIGELSIYNLKGQKIKTIFSNLSIPRNELIIYDWDGKDETGKEVSSGVYYYKLRTSKGDFIRKMILMK